MKHVKVIGAGGIGSILLPTLCRFLNASGEQVVITIIDGDDYENKNQTRQLFSRLGNKAKVSVEKLSGEFPGIVFQAKPEYLTDKSALYLLKDGDIIFSCVDNHKTRLLISDFCSEELENVVLFSGGNSFTDGNIQIFIKKDDKNLTLPIANSYHPEIMKPSDRRPDEIGCGELIVSEPQLIFTNNAVATLMLNAFYSHFYNGGCDYNEVYVDILTNNSRSVQRT
ncbi:MAG: ThiF family adenylyltransferase [Candidatus Falkowbacteria bacterium]|nr:ThiF family adenylyltransferase [Candidatus Falkowbacteria bacterium]